MLRSYAEGKRCVGVGGFIKHVFLPQCSFAKGGRSVQQCLFLFRGDRVIFTVCFWGCSGRVHFRISIFDVLISGCLGSGGLGIGGQEVIIIIVYMLRS